jgi:2-polyprenyl-3-methyl-5-hydroxy-6-metoxy-1,4-benzoquinol methylase
MTDALSQFRLRAAIASGGTSSSVIKDLVIKIVQRHGLRGTLLDFGAGRGELLQLMMSSGRFERLSGADLLDRPPDLPDTIAWYTQDLNTGLILNESYDVVICSEVIEHLENPRATLRNLSAFLVAGGVLILTMPNQESLRSYLALLLGGHFAQFRGECYPAHITALLRLDLERICLETGFEHPLFYYSDEGRIPKLTAATWQGLSFGLLKGRLFSDNLAMIVKTKLPQR